MINIYIWGITLEDMNFNDFTVLYPVGNAGKAVDVMLFRVFKKISSYDIHIMYQHFKL